MKKVACVWVGLMLVWSVSVMAEAPRVDALEVAHHPASGLTVVSGTVRLPGKGIWTLSQPEAADAPLVDISLSAPAEVRAAALGRRGNALEQERRERNHRSALNGAYWPLAKWARKHGNRLPRLSELAKPERKSVERAFNSLPALPRQLLETPAGPHAMLVPHTVFEFATPRREGYEYVRGTNASPLLVELHPLTDDGKHYVLRANGRIERVAIDAALMKRLGAAVVPLKLDPTAGTYPEWAAYRFLARRQSEGPLQLTLTNQLSGASLALQAPAVGDDVKENEGLLKEWTTRQVARWEYAAGAYDAPGLRTWGWLQRAMHSSSTSSGAFLRKARARAIRCR